jgi:hypothetical protein
MITTINYKFIISLKCTCSRFITHRLFIEEKLFFIKTGRRSLTMHLHMQLLQILEQQDFGEFFVDNCSESSDLVRGRIM